VSERARARRRCWRRVALAAAVLVGAVGAAAQPAPFGSVETVVAVDVPVHVTSDGRPVAGLRADDFEVFDGRRRQPIVEFDVVDLATAPGAGAARAVDPALPPAARRYFVLLLDLTHAEPLAVVRARSAAQQWVARSLEPSDLVAVATWSYSRGTLLHHPFSADREQIERVLATLSLEPQRERLDPLGLLLADIERGAPGGPPPGRRAPPGDADDPLLADLERLAAAERGARRGAREAAAVAFARGLERLARMLASAPGRKQVVLLSQGFDSSLLQGVFDAAASAAEAAAAASGEIWQIDTRQRYGDARIGSALARAITELRRADCAIQSIDVGGLAPETTGEAADAAGRGTLVTLARETGGELYANFVNLGEAMARLLDATRVTYVLTLTPRGLAADGKFHELRVRLRGGPAGARVRHRPGYFAPLPDGEREAPERQLETAYLLVAGAPGGELAAAITAPVFARADGRAHVPVVVEVEGRALLAEAGRRESVPISAYVYAFDGEGRVADFAAQSVELELRELAPRLRREPLKMVGDLLLPAGRYSLRTLLRVGTSSRHFLAHRELEVPPPATGGLRVAAPLAVEPLERGVIVRLTAGRRTTEGLPFPFMRRGEYLLPIGSPRLSERSPLDLLLIVDGLDSGSVEIHGELVDGDGRPAADVALFVTGDELSVDGRRRFSLAAALAGVQPGAYGLRLAVRQGEREAAAELAVEVVR
jgi:VWFA-related protein